MAWSPPKHNEIRELLHYLECETVAHRQMIHDLADAADAVVRHCRQNDAENAKACKALLVAAFGEDGDDLRNDNEEPWPPTSER